MTSAIMQSKNAVSDYFASKLILHFDFVEQNISLTLK